MDRGPGSGAARATRRAAQADAALAYRSGSQ
jgi:hypothetical protein